MSIEFAFVIYPFLGICIAILQVSLAQYYVSALDRATQSFAAQLRSGAVVLRDQSAANIIDNNLCPLLPLGLQCASLQVQLINNSTCQTTAGCWRTAYTGLGGNFPKAIRNAPAFASPSVFTIGVAGDSQYLMVFYPQPAMSPIWDKAYTTQIISAPCTNAALISGTCSGAVSAPIHGLLSTAMWINDPSVGVFLP